MLQPVYKCSKCGSTASERFYRDDGTTAGIRGRRCLSCGHTKTEETNTYHTAILWKADVDLEVEF